MSTADLRYRVFEVRMTWRRDSEKHPTGAMEIEAILNAHPNYHLHRIQAYSRGGNEPGFVDEVLALVVLRRNLRTKELVQ
ncbi:MAG: hypothetical protein IT165_06030 [Bryobacterales bacterium]|nr:hypothetical protein [Bryobacterales bacterium]